MVKKNKDKIFSLIGIFVNSPVSEIQGRIRLLESMGTKK